MMLNNELTLGLDLGIGSCGWALIRNAGGDGEIVAMGSRTFDVPETDKERTPTNQLRRQFRGLRRVLKRRRSRMSALRSLFSELGMIENDRPSALKVSGLDPWALRAEGLDRKLTGPELAVALGHIAKHRGFKSNSKRDRGANAASDSSKMLREIETTKSKLIAWRTVGEMFAKDEAYGGRKRNRDGDYSRSILRDDQEREVRVLLDIQRRSGNALASETLEERFIATAFYQRPLQDSDALVGTCPFESSERRAAKHAPSFERFRFLSRLTNLRLAGAFEEAPLSADQIAIVEAGFGEQKSVTFKTLRKKLALSDAVRFAGVAVDDEKNDFVTRTAASCEGVASLRSAIVDYAGLQSWQALQNSPEKLDSAAGIISFREDLTSIAEGLAALEFEPLVLAALIAGVEDGRSFAKFKGAGHISSKACRALVPHLRRGLVYSVACTEAGYDHSARPTSKLQDINNPVARKSLSEGLKQVKAIVSRYGLPGAIHVELARDVGKSKDERDDIRNGIEKRNKAKDRLRTDYEEVVGRACLGADDLLRFELWREQNGRCLYSDQDIHPRHLIASDNTVQVDHILPWSRSGDDSFVNKTLCFTKANQEKRGSTPFEWLGSDAARWSAFVAAVESLGMKGRKKRNYLLKDAKVLEEKFRPRNLNDTRYACRLLADELKGLYPDDGQRRVYTRPGSLTNRLRQAWGLQSLKKDQEGNRLSDDRHHALDALIVAATSESALQRLTLAAQLEESRGSSRFIANFPPPWSGFLSETREKWPTVFVSRAERRRARGEAHAQTVRRVGETDDGPAVYERKAVDRLTLGDLAKIKDPDRNQTIIKSLTEWIEAGKPKSPRPLSGKGDPISKVTLLTHKKVDVLVRDGAADRGEMTRVDVFRKKSKKGEWEFYVVPIYPHQIFDAASWSSPPNKAVSAHKPESDWPEMGSDHEFLWSIYPRCYLEVEKSDGVTIEGYFAGMDRAGGAIHLFAHNSKAALVRGIGVKTLKLFKKYDVDRLGNRNEILQETRTWRGVACT